ncbi:uncharacterized protein SAPINGB_P000317 [Magnusiomyces paraingens]|uniref:Eukaryotic translation initiation factor 3 subunit D n=1 Tax=Magnusiomyces paraingens TaxID=2606893 RepID=A0A5E8B5G8_9ASCO|nr:uncharacterized protein SAPINGB_P000317 [Saprochaete ingens]VVT44140.1 unnamed protein product [Saprochaete ingens]
MSFDHIFTVPAPASETYTWGPPAEIPTAIRFNDVPYAPYSKSDKLGKLSDWAESAKDSKDNKRNARGHKDPYHAYGASAAASFFNTEDAADNSSFSIVDSSKTPKTRQTAILKANSKGGSRGSSGPNSSSAGGSSGGASASRSNGPGRNGPAGSRNLAGGPASGPNSRRRYGWKEERPQRNRDASVKVAEGWELIQSNGFNELQKLSFDVKSGTDVGSYGYVYPYNRALDKPNHQQKLKLPDRAIFNTTTSYDPVIQKLAAANTATIFATDSILSLLMCTTKSVYPWDVIINKADGKIFFDKRDDGPLDYVTVDENTYEPPSDTSDKSNINSATNLANEATYINQNFAANAIVESSAQKISLEHPHPFFNPDDAEALPPLPSGYRYRKFNLAENPEDEPINLVVRTEVDALVPGKTDQYVTVKALNEYGPNGILSWKNKFSNQRGSIVAAEMKKNLNKLSRWTIEAILAGSSSMKIGFVSRNSPKDNAHHIIVGVVGQVPEQFANQLNIKLSNGWGIIKSIVNIIAALDDGKYVLMKDPNASAIKIYRVPANAFDEDEEEEE